MQKSKSISMPSWLSNATGSIPIRMTNDYLFKALLQRNNQALISLVCSILRLTPSRISSAVITNPIILGDYIDEKTIILDVRVIFNNNSIVNLEMQVTDQKDWEARSLYYLCRNYTNLKPGEPYDSALPAYHIGLLDYSLFPKDPEFLSCYYFQNVRSHHVYSRNLSLYVVDLTHIELATKEDRRYGTDRWARLFKSTTWEEIKMLATQDDVFKSVATDIYQLSEDDRIRMQIEAREDWLRRENGRKRREAQYKKSIAEKDAQISEKDAEIAELKKQLAALTQQP